MRIIVEKGQVEDGREFFALSEIFVMEQRESGMVNVAPYSQRSTSAHFQSYPYWDIRFIADRLSPLGSPLGVDVAKDTDFIAKFPLMRNEETVEMVFDFGEEQKIGRAAFYPADPPSNILLPHFGYPDKLVIEVFSDSLQKEPVYRMEVFPDYKLRTHEPHIHFRPVTDLAFAVPMAGARGRYVRVTASGLSDYDQSSIIAFGEIVFWGADQNLSMGCKVTMTPSSQGSDRSRARSIGGWVCQFASLLSIPINGSIAWLSEQSLERELAVVNHSLTLNGKVP